MPDKLSFGKKDHDLACDMAEVAMNAIDTDPTVKNHHAVHELHMAAVLVTATIMELFQGLTVKLEFDAMTELTTYNLGEAIRVMAKDQYNRILEDNQDSDPEPDAAA